MAPDPPDQPVDADPVRALFVGAHPDDCDLKAGGTAALMAQQGHAVKFVSLTDGAAGHHEMGGGPLAKRRRAEAETAARRLGIDAYEVMPHADGEVRPTLEIRRDVIQCIREWDADVVVGHRPNDYHPDHRYGGQVVQDAAYMVQVPNELPTVAPTEGNLVFLYFEDRFRKPVPFEHDIVVGIDPVLDRKVDALDAHASQFYGWLAKANGLLDAVPDDPAARPDWLKDEWIDPATDAARDGLTAWYGTDAPDVQYTESFEIAEYGRQPTDAEVRRLFPMLPT